MLDCCHNCDCKVTVQESIYYIKHQVEHNYGCTTCTNETKAHV